MTDHPPDGAQCSRYLGSILYVRRCPNPATVSAQDGCAITVWLCEVCAERWVEAYPEPRPEPLEVTE